MNSVTQLVQQIFNAIFDAMSTERQSDNRKMLNEKRVLSIIIPTGDKSLSHSTAFDISGELTTDKNTIANSFCCHFTSCAEKLCGNLPSIFNWRNESEIYQASTHFQVHLITKQKVLRHLLNLKSTKAPGHDNLPPKC